MTISPQPNWEFQLKKIYDRAVQRYRDGMTSTKGFFNDDELTFLHSIGHTGQEVFDFAEDRVQAGEPEWETFLLIAAVRRDYFLVVQEGKPSTHIVPSESLPAKDAEIDGIVWLPRIIEKAFAKLKGEMNPDLMFSCGGDRRFFKENNVHPADLLRHAWGSENDHQKIIDYVKACRDKK